MFNCAAMRGQIFRKKSVLLLVALFYLRPQAFGVSGWLATSWRIYPVALTASSS